jgi:hypothetical protein
MKFTTLIISIQLCVFSSFAQSAPAPNSGTTAAFPSSAPMNTSPNPGEFNQNPPTMNNTQPLTQNPPVPVPSVDASPAPLGGRSFSSTPYSSPTPSPAPF